MISYNLMINQTRIWIEFADAGTIISPQILIIWIKTSGTWEDKNTKQNHAQEKQIHNKLQPYNQPTNQVLPTLLSLILV